MNRCVHELRVEVRPPWQFRLRGGSADGLLRRKGASLQRLLHRDGAPVHVAVVQAAPDRVIFGARAESEPDAMWGIRRLRFATGVDDDLRPFYDAFHGDPVIGKAVRAAPELRVRRAPLPWEALSNAVTEQLIEFERAVAIQRRMIAALGVRCARTGLRDGPAPATIAGTAPARLAAMDLAPARALTMRRVAAEVASGRVDLLAADPMPGWRRLRAVPGVGPWTLEVLALYGQGHHDRVPAGDLGYLKLVGRVTTGNPRARADELTVREFFDRYGEWKGLAGEYLRLAAARGLLPVSPARSAPGRAPRRQGTRWSSPARRSAAA
jgi:DNA-3-methyladenine glycosylase II